MNYEVPEDVGIKSIRIFYEKIKEMMDKDDSVVLDFMTVKSIHLAVALVVMAAHREAKRKGKTIRLKNVSDGVRHQLYLSGFNL